MDLSHIPLAVLRAEVEAVGPMMSSSEYINAPTPICVRIRMHLKCLSTCPVGLECSGLIDDSPCWSKRKERYLQRLRAEIEARA
jgi:hypothetical protein